MLPKPPSVFGGNARVTHEAIIAGQRQATLKRLGGEALVLRVQDTTRFDFAHQPASSGLGTLENE